MARRRPPAQRSDKTPGASRRVALSQAGSQLYHSRTRGCLPVGLVCRLSTHKRVDTMRAPQRALRRERDTAEMTLAHQRALRPGAVG